MESQYKPPEIKSAKAIFSKLLTNCKPQPFIFFSLKAEFREKFQFGSHTLTYAHIHITYRYTKHELGHQSYVALSLFTKEVKGPGSAIKQREDFSLMSEGRCSIVPGSFGSCGYSHVNNLEYSGIWSSYLYSHVETAGRNSKMHPNQKTEVKKVNQTVIDISKFSQRTINLKPLCFPILQSRV